MVACLFALLTGCDREEGVERASADVSEIALAKPAQETERVEPRAEPKRDAPAVVADTEPLAADEADAAAPPDASEPSPRASRDRKKKSGSRRRASSGKEDAVSVETPAASTPAGEITLKRIQFSERIEGREPVDPEETFSAGEKNKLYAFVELTNKSKQATKITVTFVPPMGASSKVTLDVGEVPRWRTWAKRSGTKAVGTWQVIVRDIQGKEIGRRSFEVTE